MTSAWSAAKMKVAEVSVVMRALGRAGGDRGDRGADDRPRVLAGVGSTLRLGSTARTCSGVAGLGVPLVAVVRRRVGARAPEDGRAGHGSSAHSKDASGSLLEKTNMAGGSASTTISAGGPDIDRRRRRGRVLDRPLVLGRHRVDEQVLDEALHGEGVLAGDRARLGGQLGLGVGLGRLADDERRAVERALEDRRPGRRP